MNVSYVVIILVFCFIVVSAAQDKKPIQKRILKLKNVNYNKTEKKPKTGRKSQKNKTIFLLTNPVKYPQNLDKSKPNAQKLERPKPTETLSTTTGKSFDFLNFDAYIVKPFNVNYTALLSHRPNDIHDTDFSKEYKSFDYTTNYPQFEVLDFARAEPLIQTTISPHYETTAYETTTLPSTPKTTTTYLPLGLAFFDSLRKYRKAFDTLRSNQKKKAPKRTTKQAYITTTTPTTIETDAPFVESTTTSEFYRITTPFDENVYNDDVPYFESYRSSPRFSSHYDYDSENEKNQHDTPTRYSEYEKFRLDNDEDKHESVTTTETSPNSKRRNPNNKNLHSANVKSNFLFDRFINYPQGDESRRVFSVAKSDNYQDVKPAGNDTQSDQNKGERKDQQNSVPMQRPQPTQRHYFQYVNVINDGTYNAGVGKGNENHYIEQHELAVPKNGTFQKKVRWNDKKGGFGELYYDLNHH